MTATPDLAHMNLIAGRYEIEENGCWRWTGPIQHNGYGRINRGGTERRRTYMAHRVSYEVHVGPIPDGLTLDHLCKNRACINPEHLEPVTQGENSLRGDGPCAVNARKTHCIRGHEFTPENTFRTYRGRRGCLKCRIDHSRKARQRAREQRGAIS